LCLAVTGLLRLQLKKLIMRVSAMAVCRKMVARSMLLLLSAGNVGQTLAADEFATFIFENDVITDVS
jgi:hypothetical protein